MSMKAIILAGGRGQRLMPLTAECPKPLVPFMDRPILDHILTRLAHAGCTEVVLALGYQADAIMAFVEDGRRWGLDVRYRREEHPLGTAGAVRLAVNGLPSAEPVLVVSGDGMTDVDLGAFYRQAVASRADGAVLLARVPDPRPYGMVALDDRNRIRQFIEKPSRIVADALVNTGIYVFTRRLLEEIPLGVAADFGHEWLPRWIARGKQLIGVVGDGYWTDVGTVEQYRQAHEAVLSGKMRFWDMGRKEWNPAVRVSGPAYIAPGAVVDPTAHIGPYAVIGDGVRVMPWARVERAIFARGAVVGAHSQVKGAVVAEDVELAGYSVIDEDVVIGRRVRVGYGAHVFPGTRLNLGTAVKPGAHVYAHHVIKDKHEREEPYPSIQTTVKVW